MVVISLPTPDTLDQMSTMDPEIEIQRSKPQLSWQAAEDMDPEDLIHSMRAAYKNMPLPPPNPAVKEWKSFYMNKDGIPLDLLTFEPADRESESLSLFVWYFGGGGCIGSPESTAPFCRSVVLEHNCIVVAPQYRLAPEHRFPTQVEDSWATLQHIAAYAREELNADPAKGFVIGGESAGAVIAAVLALRARDELLRPQLTGTYLTAGSYFNPDDIPAAYKDHYRSRHDPTCINSPMLNKPVKAAFDACMQGDYSSPFFKAALWPSGQAGLPRTYLQTCGMDVNRDDGIMYADMLSKSGVETKLDVYPGCPHCFWHLFPDTQQGKKWKVETRAGIAWLFEYTA